MTTRLLILAAALMAVQPALAAPDAIDEAFATAAPKILAALKAKKCENVGVLKFLVAKGKSTPSDAVGELNGGLADRLEAALILECKDESFGIIHRAGPAVVARKNGLANHLTVRGRKAFFGLTYALAWGSEEVKPSAFITGLATVSPDLKTVSIKVQGFTSNGELEDLLELGPLAASRRTLVEAGYSYALTAETAEKLIASARAGKKASGGMAEGKAVIYDEKVDAKAEEDVVGSLVSLKEPERPEVPKLTPANALATSPVKLTILYDGKEIPIEEDRVREPLEGEKVTLRLENTDKANLYAVVLKVNGKNTLFSQDAEPEECLKWILEKGAKLDITGFQETDNESVDFKIKSAAESEEDVVRYGDVVGTIRLSVFHGQQVMDDPSAGKKKEPEFRLAMLAAVARGSKGLRNKEIKPGSLDVLQADLRGRVRETEGQRGAIGKGDTKQGSAIEKIFFQALPAVPVADVTVRYYSPKGSGGK